MRKMVTDPLSTIDANLPFRRALEMVRREVALVKAENPDWAVHQVLHEARHRCHRALTAVTGVMERMESHLRVPESANLAQVSKSSDQVSAMRAFVLNLAKLLGSHRLH